MSTISDKRASQLLVYATYFDSPLKRGRSLLTSSMSSHVAFVFSLTKGGKTKNRTPSTISKTFLIS